MELFLPQAFVKLSTQQFSTTGQWFQRWNKNQCAAQENHFHLSRHNKQRMTKLYTYSVKGNFPLVISFLFKSHNVFFLKMCSVYFYNYLIWQNNTGMPCKNSLKLSIFTDLHDTTNHSDCTNFQVLKEVFLKCKSISYLKIIAVKIITILEEQILCNDS